MNLTGSRPFWIFDHPHIWSGPSLPFEDGELWKEFLSHGEIGNYYNSTVNDPTQGLTHDHKTVEIFI